MCKTILIAVLFSLTITKSTTNQYDKIFPNDFKNALRFLSNNTNKFKASANKYSNNPQLLSTIVFPELMRYSVVSDLLETSALELVYINNGSDAADFSIGRFQMKPSFVELIEIEIEKNKSLQTVYSCLHWNSKLSLKERRQARINRLQNIDWQLIYLNAYVSLGKQRFENITFDDVKDSLAFYACAYNTGFTKDVELIEASTNKQYFPYGANYRGKQYSYSDVACYFYDYTFEKKIKYTSINKPKP